MAGVVSRSQGESHVPFNLDSLANVAFDKPSFGRRGYREAEVDAFLDRIERTLRAHYDGTDAPTDALSAADVHHITFHKSGFADRGYDEQEVDDFLDTVEEELDRLLDPQDEPVAPTALRPRSVPGMLGPEQVHEVEFNRAPFGKRGYDEQQVDLFLDRIEATLLGNDNVTVEEIHDVLFAKPPIGKRGYNEDQVDAFLDRVERTLTLRAAS
jgi:DivIVA domain-containing protein